jgi:hypothetical protein
MGGKGVRKSRSLFFEKKTAIYLCEAYVRGLKLLYILRRPVFWKKKKKYACEVVQEALHYPRGLRAKFLSANY